MAGNPNCSKCQGRGRLRGKDGSIGVCIDCLQSGSMDQHDKKPKSAEDYRLKL